jgi:methionine-gamma-lyase
MSGADRLSLDTRIVHSSDDHAAFLQGDQAVPHNPPIVQTTNFDYPDSSAADAAAEGRGWLYSRSGNPTVATFAQAVAELEGAEAGCAFSSGMAAASCTLRALATPGDHVVYSEGIYGGAQELLSRLLPRDGISTTAVAPTAAAIEAALLPRTRVVYVEAITNPLLRVCDIEAVGHLCATRGVALVVDATFATPVLMRPLSVGATLVLHSASKYLAGHGDVLAGVVCGARTDLSRVAAEQVLTGGVLDPFAAWLALRGMKTLALRVRKQVSTALDIARRLEDFSGVERVHYPGLASHPDHGVAIRHLGCGGAMVSFVVKGGLDGARRVYDRVRVIRRAASLGEVESLLTHPASFSHRGLGPEERRRQGIEDGLLRLSVGIEDVVDLIADLRQALA